MNSIRPILEALEESHKHLNASLFGSSLKTQPVITIQSRGRKSVYGWYGCDHWKNEVSTPAELNIVAEELHRKPGDILGTLLHEMCHQKASESKIKDCSRNGRYHNRKFKEIAEKHGLLTEEKSKALGFGVTKLAPAGRAAIDCLMSKVTDALTVSRIPAVPGKSKSKMLLYMCDCGFKIRCGKSTLEATCNLCQSPFVNQDATNEKDGV